MREIKEGDVWLCGKFPREVHRIYGERVSYSYIGDHGLAANSTMIEAFIDCATALIERDGKEYKRSPEVGDTWRHING